MTQPDAGREVKPSRLIIYIFVAASILILALIHFFPFSVERTSVDLIRRDRAPFAVAALAVIIITGAAVNFIWRRERKRHAESLRNLSANSRRTLASAVDTTLDISFNPAFRRDSKHRITGCNVTFVERPKSERIGADYWALFRGHAAGQAAGEAEEKPTARVYEILFKSPSGIEHELIVAEAFIVYAGSSETEYIGQIVDITNRKKAEEELRQLKDFSDETVRTMTEGLILTDPRGTITFANPAAAAMLGYIPQELVGVDSKAIVAPDQQEKVEEMDRRRAEGYSDRYELDFIRKDGSRRTFLVSGGPRPGGVQPRGTMAILTDITERKRMEEEIRALSLTDELTGLLNRRGFLTLATQHLKIASRMSKKTILLFMDVDDLKGINDTYGHSAGDRALKEIAGLLKKNFRESDVVARYGGDEFVVLAIEETETQPEKIIERLQFRIDAYNARAELDKSYKLYLSFGHAVFDADFPVSVEDLIARADILMYQHKRSKKRAY
jgi:diguanylate cyclase (GGDEF)-like protein/PAS domain S-box-containing protein